MANLGDLYDVCLTRAALEWGTYRFTGSREQIYGEGYIPIPSAVAREFVLYNNNGTGDRDVYGENLFCCMSEDGLYRGVLRSQGCNRAGSIYAKQFAGDGDLKALGDWYYKIDAQIGDIIRVTWLSSTEILIKKI